MSDTFRLSTLAALVALVTACGGGGGGGNGPVPVANDATINTGNAREIAGEVVSGVMETGSLGEFGALGGLIGTVPGGSLTLSNMAATAAMKSGKAQASAVGGMMYAPFGPEKTACAAGGTVTVSASIRVVGTLSAGDRFALGFENCDDGEGEVVHGDISLDVDSFSGDLPGGAFRIAATLSFEVFAVTDDDDTKTVNGDFSLLLDSMNYPTMVFSHSSASLSVTESGETLVLANWSTTLTVDESSHPAAYDLTGSGRIDVPRHGNVTYEVLTPFTGFGDDDPDGGVLYVEGGEGANITITALSSAQAQLEMDYDGDGDVDETAILTWVELDD